MPIAFWCVLLAGVLPLATVAIAKRSGPGFDNHDPRGWLDRQSGRARRADMAHRNHFEAFPFFAAAVLTASYLQAPQARIDELSMVFILTRLLYTVCYLTDRATLRSLCWTIGYLSVVGIFLLPVFVH
ncbi:MAPEG family protein [Cupriavidus consociatus]|uniref:MAPEG family protein n=1 Tax=Cupriavidus consociatus TaxID=2821357 RepID=UPI001AE18F26|nr:MULTISPECIES: MAPEG family protein [unclassified Cupriavidus]MBP0621765.1 MAPEG family protein [Cupriavidus sp. LEh25]MDK2658440.1 MAPEG family protein [Cupriavidus sp. LEh21]